MAHSWNDGWQYSQWHLPTINLSQFTDHRQGCSTTPAWLSNPLLLDSWYSAWQVSQCYLVALAAFVHVCIRLMHPHGYDLVSIRPAAHDESVLPAAYKYGLAGLTRQYHCSQVVLKHMKAHCAQTGAIGASWCENKPMDPGAPEPLKCKIRA